MKSHTPQLAALLATGTYVRADLWTITLLGGTIIRWSSQDIPLTFGGVTWPMGPAISRGSISEKVGMEVSTLEADIIGGPSDLVQGVPVIQFIRKHGFDGAVVKLERAYAPDWNSPIVGTIVRFTGKVTSTQTQGITSKITISDWKYLLGYPAPRNIVQVPCMRVLYDSQCGVNPASYQATGSIVTATTQALATGLSNAAAYFSQGRIIFTSGVNNGQTRTVKTDDGNGNLVLMLPLITAPSPGDTFTVWAGCDLAQSTCQNKFNNLLKFKATPFVPPPSVITGTNTFIPNGGAKG